MCVCVYEQITWNHLKLKWIKYKLIAQRQLPFLNSTQTIVPLEKEEEEQQQQQQQLSLQKSSTSTSTSHQIVQRGEKRSNKT